MWLSPALICFEQLELVHLFQAVPLSGVFSTSSSWSLGWLVFVSIPSTFIWLRGMEKITFCFCHSPTCISGRSCARDTTSNIYLNVQVRNTHPMDGSLPFLSYTVFGQSASMLQAFINTVTCHSSLAP